MLARRLGDGWDVFRTGRAPVPVTDGVLLLCMVLTATVAATADALAFRSEATLAAVVPSLLLFVFASTLGTADLRTPTTIGYAITALVFLMLQHQALLEAHRSWFSGRRLGSHATLVNAAAFVGGVALLSGIVIAPALPGADDGPLIDYRTFGGSRGAGAPSSYSTLSPLVNLRGQLLAQSDSEVFRVKASTRLYWRIAGLDDFDGEVWGIESQARDVGDELGRERPAGTVRQNFTISGLTDQWLPAAYRPRATDLDDARVVPETGTLVAPDEDITGLTYRVDSEVVTTEPNRSQILATRGEVPDGLSSSLELPDDFPDRVTRQARAIVAGATTPYAKALRLQQFFLEQGRFVYDLRGPIDGSSSSAIEDFLESRRGFCEQFAGAYAAMARAVGLPARVAVGFAPGSYEDGEFRRARPRHAHVWPEVWLAGLGWTQFEPTPVGDQPGQADPTVGQPVAGNVTNSTTTTTTATSSTSSATPNASGVIPRGEANVQAGSASAGGGSSAPRPWLALAIAAVVAAIAGVVWLIMRVGRKVARRSRRRKRVGAGALGRRRVAGSPGAAERRRAAAEHEPHATRAGRRLRGPRRAAGRDCSPGRSRRALRHREVVTAGAHRGRRGARLVRRRLRARRAGRGCDESRACPPRPEGLSPRPTRIRKTLGAARRTRAARRRTSAPRRRPHGRTRRPPRRASCPRRSASRICPSSWQAHTLSPFVTSRRPAMSSPDATR